MCLQKKIAAKTPEALMRSRYTAYVEGKIDYIRRTMRSPARLNFNKKSITKRPREWLGLQVITSYLDPDNSNIGYVEFIAKYRLENIEAQIHEISEFHFIEGRWYYVDGKSNIEN